MGFTIRLKPGDTNTSAKAFFLKDGRILLVKPTGSENKYDIPGGKIKIGCPDRSDGKTSAVMPSAKSSPRWPRTAI